MKRDKSKTPTTVSRIVRGLTNTESIDCYRSNPVVDYRDFGTEACNNETKFVSNGYWQTLKSGSEYRILNIEIQGISAVFFHSKSWIWN